MAISGLDIYKLLPKTNCKECGFSTCLAFAMALAQKKTSLDKCPHITAAAREALDSASQPPIKLVTIGAGAGKVEIGNETVMYRHEQKFFHPCAIGLTIEDTSSSDSISKKLADISGLKFERVGREISVDLICIKNTSLVQDKLLDTVKKVVSSSDKAIALFGPDPEVIGGVLGECKDRRPLLVASTQEKVDGFIRLAKDNGLPLGLTCGSIEEAANLSDKAKQAGVAEIILNICGSSVTDKIQNITLMRRAALKKNVRSLGYPVMAFVGSTQKDIELAEAVSYTLKYAGIVVMDNTDKDFIFPLLVARQDVYQDPQKPVQVEPKIYEIGKVNSDSPVLVTTNFSITYFTVAGEVEASKVPAYIISCDAEGMSVLTAWAAEKFTAEKIANTLDTCGIKDMVTHRKVVLPGYVSVLSGKLEEASGWKVMVGPREASGISNFLRSWK